MIDDIARRIALSKAKITPPRVIFEVFKERGIAHNFCYSDFQARIAYWDRQVARFQRCRINRLKKYERQREYSNPLDTLLAIFNRQPKRLTYQPIEDAEDRHAKEQDRIEQGEYGC